MIWAIRLLGLGVFCLAVGQALLAIQIQTLHNRVRDLRREWDR